MNSDWNTRAIGVALGVMTFAGSGFSPQKPSPADLAAKLSGTWTLNAELSPGFSAPGRGGRGGGGGPALAIGSMGVQRGGRGGTGGDLPNGPADLTPEERAGQAAIRQLQQIAATFAINATPESVTFTDPRGEQTFAINDKNMTIDIAGAKITARNKWDKASLRQEFSNPKSKLVRTWEIDENNRLLLKAKLESMTLMSTEVKAVFDRQ